MQKNTFGFYHWCATYNKLSQLIFMASWSFERHSVIAVLAANQIPILVFLAPNLDVDYSEHRKEGIRIN